MRHVTKKLNDLPTDANEFTVLLKKQKKMKANLKWMHKNVLHGFI